MHIKKNNITSEQRYIPGIAQEKRHIAFTRIQIF